MNYLAMASRAFGGPKNRRMRCRRLPTTRPTPRGLQEPICPRKKCAIWTRWRPVPVKNVNYPRAPSSRRSGLVGPHTTPPIELQVYDIYIIRRVLLAAHARDVNILIWTARKSVGHERNDRVKVHGDGTRADGRRFMSIAQISEILGSRDGQAARSIVGSRAIWYPFGPVFWPVPQLKRLKRKFIVQTTGLGPFWCSVYAPSSAENGQVGRS